MNTYHTSISSSLNDIPKFSREWFQLKEREILLRSSMSANADVIETPHDVVSEKKDTEQDASSIELLSSGDDAPRSAC